MLNEWTRPDRLRPATVTPITTNISSDGPNKTSHISKTNRQNSSPTFQSSCTPVSEMTYTVSSGTLNSTIPYHTDPAHRNTDRQTHKVNNTTSLAEEVTTAVCRVPSQASRGRLDWRGRSWSANPCRIGAVLFPRPFLASADCSAAGMEEPSSAVSYHPAISRHVRQYGSSSNNSWKVVLTTSVISRRPSVHKGYWWHVSCL